jgi:hypothetical protein
MKCDHTLEISISVRVTLNEDGSVNYVSPINDQRVLVEVVEKTHTVESRVAIHRAATASKLAEGKVRVVSSGSMSSGLEFYTLVRTTKLHIVLRDKYGIESKWQRKNGYRVGSSGFLRPSIHHEDLAALDKSVDGFEDFVTKKMETE